MKKIITILLSLLMVVSLAACSNNNNNNNNNDNNNNSKVTLTAEEIEAKLKEKLGDDYHADVDIEENFFFVAYDVDKSQIESYVTKQNTLSFLPDTVIILQVKDGYADRAVEILQERFDQSVSYASQYPFETAKVLNGRIYQNGNYVALIIAGADPADDATAEQENTLALEQYALIDEVWESIFSEAKNIAVVNDYSDINSAYDSYDTNEIVIGG